MKPTLPSNRRVERATQFYRAMLRLLPSSHRREYGPLMSQLFRDQCRDANREGVASAWVRLWLRALPDLAASFFREHLTEQTTRMKTVPPSTLALILAVAAIAAAFLSCGLAPISLAIALAYASSLLLLARAVVECFRPRSQLLSSLVWGAVIAIIFGFIVPVWHKIGVARPAARFCATPASL